MAARAFLEQRARAAAAEIRLDVGAVHAADEIVNGHAEGLALDVPQRQVERAERVDFFAARRVEPRAIHVLPATLDVEWVFADEALRALLDGVARAAFADADQPGLVGLDRDDHVALVEMQVEIRRAVDVDLGDPCLGQGAESAGQKGRGSGADDEIAEKNATSVASIRRRGYGG